VYYLQLKLEAAHVRTSPSKNKKTGFSGGGGGSFAAIVDFIEKKSVLFERYFSR
jgi:predicted metal-dependent peptidase